MSKRLLTNYAFVEGIKENLGYDLYLSTQDEVVDCTSDNDYIVILARRIHRIRQMELTREQAKRAVRLWRYDVDAYFVPTMSDYNQAKTYLKDFGLEDFNQDDKLSTKMLLEAADNLEGNRDFLTPGAYDFLCQYLDRTIYKRASGFAYGRRLTENEWTDADKWLQHLTVTLFNLNDYKDLSLQHRRLTHDYIDQDTATLSPNMKQYLHEKIEF